MELIQSGLSAGQAKSCIRVTVYMYVCMFTERIECIPHYAIRSLSQFLGNRVSLVDDEILIENSEELSALQVIHRHVKCEYVDYKPVFFFAVLYWNLFFTPLGKTRWMNSSGVEEL